MNRSLWRVIFNRRRQLWVVVAEIADTAGRCCSRRTAGNSAVSRSLKLLAFLVLAACGRVWPGEIRRDTSAPATQQPVIMRTASGLPQINIQTPGSGGVSVNKFSRFDVESPGAVINNSHKQTQTRLAGMITANPYLIRGEARVIVSQVNSAGASQLKGYLEVAGKRAQVVIANPAGISCDGCGFINAAAATLTTGQAQMSRERIAGYAVERGEISIGRGGMDAGGADYAALLARALKLNGDIQAQTLHITAGRSEITQDGNITALADDSSEKPRFALDSAQLAGMYAGKIILTATEKGVGVNLAGIAAASAGDIILDADGEISIKGSISAAQDMRLTSQRDVRVSGSMGAGSALQISAGGRFVSDAAAFLTSEQDMRLSAARDISSDGKIYAGRTLFAQTPQTIQHRGAMLSGSAVHLQAAELRADKTSLLAAGVNRDGEKTGNGSLHVSLSGKFSDSGSLFASDDIRLNAHSADLDGARVLAADIHVQAATGSISAIQASNYVKQDF